jgi:hypothetical protein
MKRNIFYWISFLTTTFDPVFFPIHAFIDKIFELYRHKLMSRGIDPEETYPVKNIALHGPEHKTIPPEFIFLKIGSQLGRFFIMPVVTSPYPLPKYFPDQTHDSWGSFIA